MSTKLLSTLRGWFRKFRWRRATSKHLPLQTCGRGGRIGSHGRRSSQSRSIKVNMQTVVSATESNPSQNAPLYPSCLLSQFYYKYPSCQFNNLMDSTQHSSFCPSLMRSQCRPGHSGFSTAPQCYHYCLCKRSLCQLFYFGTH